MTDRQEFRASQLPLAESNELLLRSLFEHAADGIAIADSTGAFVEVNARMCTMLGYSREELLQLNVVDIVVTSERSLAASALHEMAEIPSFVPRERRYLRKDGSTFMGEVSGGRLPDGHLIGIVRDISERKQAEQALRHSEARLNEAQHNAHIGSIHLGAHGELTLSAEACELFKVSPDTSPTPAVLTSRIHPEDRDSAHLTIRQAFESNSNRFELSFRVCWPDGQVRTLHGVGQVRSDADAGLQEAFGTVQDVTEWRQAEARLEEATQRLQFAIKAGNVGLWDWNVHTNHVAYSPEWKRQIGYEEHEIGSSFEEWQTRVHPDDIGAVLETIQAGLLSDEPNLQSEFRFRHKDGTYRHILAQAALVSDRTGQRVRMVGSHVDITDWVQLQAQFLQAQKMEGLGRLAGGIAHDFNNLLSIILGVSDLALGEVSTSEPLRESFEEINEAAMRAAALTRQLLAFSRRQIMNLQPLNMNTVITDMDRMLARLIPESIALELNLAEDLGPVRADAGQLEQVIVNLVVNAGDAMPAGGRLVIETRNVELDASDVAEHPDIQAGPHVMVAVTDTGLGIDEATLARIFEPFFTTKPTGKGSGLGLAMSYGIVKQSGGNIWVTSEVGRGTTFRLYLPRLETAVEGKARGVVSLSRLTQARGAETVLVVEDEVVLGRVTARMLAVAGYEVLLANSAEDALQLIERHAGTVDLLLTDMVMPVMSGRELAARMAKIHPHVKVLFMSGYTDDAVLRGSVLDGEAPFLGKPFALAELTQTVRAVLDA